MNAFELYKNHNQTINNYLLVYVISIAVIVLIVFLLFRYNGYSSFYKGMFFTLIIAGSILSFSGLNFRKNNLKEIAVMKKQYKESPAIFLTNRTEASAQYEPHFFRLLTIWSIAIVTLVLLIIIFLKKKILAGVFTGLIICCIASLTLDFSGFLSDGTYYAALKELTNENNNIK